MEILTNSVEIKMNDGSLAKRTYNFHYPYIEWNITIKHKNIISNKFDTNFYNYQDSSFDNLGNYKNEIYCYFDGNWHKIKDNIWNICDMPDCEKKYQTLLRNKKLNRINFK